MTTGKGPTDPTRCPLCGAANTCAVQAAGDQGREAASVSDCWCMRDPVSPEALARLPIAARGLACLCPQCAKLSYARRTGSGLA